MIKTIFLVLLAMAVLAIAAVLLIALRQPDNFRVERSVRIAAPAERIFPMINDMRQMNSWSPFVKKDPNIKGVYSGPDSGPGAAHDFQGNREVGSGRVRIVDAASPWRVAMKLDMTAPMQAHNDIVFSLVAEGNATQVTWAMEGPCPFLGKVMGVVFNMDSMVGGAFEEGLADLKLRAEKA